MPAPQLDLMNTSMVFESALQHTYSPPSSHYSSEATHASTGSSSSLLDVAHHISVPTQVAAQEISQGPTQDRMAAIASSIVGQRRSVPHQGPPVHLVKESPHRILASGCGTVTSSDR